MKLHSVFSLVTPAALLRHSKVNKASERTCCSHTPTDTLFKLFDYLLHFIFIENKCLSDVIRDVKREKNDFGKRRTGTRVSRVKNTVLHAFPPAPLEMHINSRVL